MTINEFVDSLELPFEGEYRGDSYIITPENSDEFSDIFNFISLNDDLMCEEDSLATEDETQFIFTNGEFEVVLSANYEKNLYNITIGER